MTSDVLSTSSIACIHWAASAACWCCLAITRILLFAPIGSNCHFRGIGKRLRTCWSAAEEIWGFHEGSSSKWIQSNLRQWSCPSAWWWRSSRHGFNYCQANGKSLVSSVITENFTSLLTSVLNELCMTGFKCFHVVGSEWGLGKIEDVSNNTSKTTGWSTADS